MKTFDQLTRQQREDAIDFAAYELMDHVAKGSLDITLVDAASQKRLEIILSAGRKTENTRLVKLHLLHDKPIRTEIYRLAIVAATGSSYNEDGSVFMEDKSETVKHLFRLS